jgi:hypothetical protein
MTTDKNQHFEEIELRLDALLADTDTMEGAVETGAALAALIKKAGAMQDRLKASIREEAVRKLQGVPGTVNLNGTDKGVVHVTIPAPKLQLAKDADVGLLFMVLGEEFDLYFETNVKYVPRTATPSLIEMMEDGRPKTVLLSSLHEDEGTPRVSFKRS